MHFPTAGKCLALCKYFPPEEDLAGDLFAVVASFGAAVGTQIHSGIHPKSKTLSSRPIRDWHPMSYSIGIEGIE